ncbi:hypothetical protein [Sphingomonas asaccharolytica]|uniref:hypothetical protein n=1 Tax=Sphingomonas asaccharolytica TaxID=40681 RepID=UPI000832939C|nr:hypothetical protein [Sphingomonas asaccharolytica]
MSPVTRLDTLGGRFGWLLLLVAALLARSVAPEGWMPVVNAAGGIEITVCNGAGPDDAMVLSPDGKLHHKAPGKNQPGDHVCAFSGLGIADAPPSVIADVAPITSPDAAPALGPIEAVPGRGLAAPPPPATGPPSLA